MSTAKKRNVASKKRIPASGSADTTRSTGFRTFFDRWERWIMILGAVLFWALLTFYLYHLQITNQVGDTTFVAQIFYNFKHSLISDTTFGASTIESMGSIWYRDAEEVCQMPLNDTLSRHSWWHLYFIMYLFLPLARIFDIQFLIAFVHAAIYTVIPVFAYALARMKKVSAVNATLFTVLVTQHPLWNIGLTGQFYFNRLFMPFCALLILILERKRLRFGALIITALFAASTNEIYGITIFIVLLSYLWIYRKIDIKIIVTACFFLILGIVLVLFNQANFGLYSTQTGYFSEILNNGIVPTLRNFLANFHNEKTLIFVTVNIVGMGIFAFFRPRLILPLFFLLLPSILVNIGGAEKTGWATHYHMGYFIPLIWMSTVGLTNLNDKPRIQGGLLVGFILAVSMLNPYSLEIYAKPRIALKELLNYTNYHYHHGKYDLEFRENLRRAVGDDSTVTAPEAIAYNLYDHEIYYYPMNIDTVDVVILRYDESKDGLDRFYSLNYGHQDEDLDICIRERMERIGFDFARPTIVDGWAVIRKEGVE